MDFNKIGNIEEWESFYASNNSKDKIIFKFSPICPISFMAEKKFDSWVKNLNNAKELEVAKVDVINSRSLSQLIEKQTNIRHESPQVIWLDKKGKVKWDANHYSITKGALDEQLTGEKVSFLRKIF